MRVIELHGEMDTDYIVCPITTKAEEEVKKLDSQVKQWSDGSVEIDELTDNAITYYEGLGLLSRADTEEEGLEMARDWVAATNPNVQ